MTDDRDIDVDLNGKNFVCGCDVFISSYLAYLSTHSKRFASDSDLNGKEVVFLMRQKICINSFFTVDFFFFALDEISSRLAEYCVPTLVDGVRNFAEKKKAETFLF